MVMKTRSIRTPEFPRLRGEEAIEALNDFVNELEEQRGKELTDKQTTAMIRFTKNLISSIEAETQSSTSDKEIRARWLGENEAKESQLKWLRYIFTIWNTPLTIPRTGLEEYSSLLAAKSDS